MQPRIQYDATGGAGIADRRGVGRAWHLQKVENVVDVVTKYVDAKRVWRLVGDKGIVNMVGRSGLVLRASAETLV